MSLVLLPLRAALAPQLTFPFLGTGGTGPYTYSVLPGGVGGTINPSTGVYTAPTGTGVDTIRVVDSLGAQATSPVLVGNALELFCDILQTELGLANGRVYLWDQKIYAPTDNGLFIAVGVVNLKAFGNTNRFDPIVGQIQSANVRGDPRREHHQSWSGGAGPERRSPPRPQQQLLGTAARVEQFESFSDYDWICQFITNRWSRNSYRFSLAVNLQYQVTKSKAIPYFDTFAPVAVTTEP
jgi:hypothetical protein